jgi:RNA polymerase sigma-70 factor (ECF subfamily)
MNNQDRHSLFSQLVAHHQNELYAYIFAIARNWDDTDDLYQTVCLVLWSKFDLFRPGSSFFAWARQIAKITVRNFLKHKQPWTQVSDELLDAFTASTLDARCSRPGSYMTALERCREKLTGDDERLLNLRYVEDLGSRQIGDRLGRPQQSVCQSLKRIRRWLLDCVKMELVRQEHSRETLS